MDRKVYLSNTPLNKARDVFLEHALRHSMEAQSVPTIDSVHRVTSAPVFARVSSPHYHASAMDGIAVKAAATFGATLTAPRQLIVGKDAFYVDTGGLVPHGCDAVIMIEEVYYPDPDNSNLVEIRASATPWQHIRSIGEDIVATEMILPSYHRIRPFDLGAMLNGGVFQVDVLKKPVVAVIPTGSELVPPEKPPKPGEITESNSYMFEAAVRSWGGEPLRWPIVKDEPEAIREAMQQAANQSNLVLVSAGSSAGRRDHTFDVLSQLGEVLVHGVAMKPGKPVILGKIDPVPVVGVPGYPVAAYMALELFVMPLLFCWQKQNPPAHFQGEAYISRRVLSSLKDEEFLRLKMGKVDERLVATPLPRGSGVSLSLVKADGSTSIPQNKEGLETGERFPVDFWRPPEEIENTILCLGSHDLSLDILSDFLRRSESKYFLSSAHVGSMGGIMALKRKEVHLAGIHLLDPDSGTYNTPYLEKFLPELDLYLVHLAKRELGLMVAPGNPKHILTLEDLIRGDVVFINRQKGAGTRLFLDYMLKQGGIEPSSITGYNREEFNHLSVAATVKAGSADAGLGIRAAAAALEVDFIPLTWEPYELAVPEGFFQSEPFQGIHELMRSSSFREAVERMGGYNLADSGNYSFIKKGVSDHERT